MDRLDPKAEASADERRSRVGDAWWAVSNLQLESAARESLWMVNGNEGLEKIRWSGDADRGERERERDSKP